MPSPLVIPDVKVQPEVLLKASQSDLVLVQDEATHTDSIESMASLDYKIT